jgi:hypothetical protein
MRKPKHHIISLIKITNFPEDVILGNLYCNRLQYYREAELQEIGDKFEATAVSKQWYRLVDNDLLSCPIFCMYTIEARKQDDTTTILLKDEELKKFGRYAVVITDVKEFIKRINTNLSEFSYEAVRYIDMKNPEGIDKYAIFNPIATKDNSFNHQKEFRIFSHLWALASNADFQIPNVKYISERSKKFPIGDLSGICKQFKTDELFSGINVELKIDWDFCRKDRFETQLPKLPK